MTRRTFAIELENAAQTISDLSRADLQVLLRRAALRLRNTDNLGLDGETDQALDFLAVELGTTRAEVIRTILLDWLISTGRLPVDAVEEATQGSA